MPGAVLFTDAISEMRVRPFPGHYPRPRDALRFVGHVNLAHGRVGRASSPLGRAPRRSGNARFALDSVGEAHVRKASDTCGKVALRFAEELRKS